MSLKNSKLISLLNCFSSRDWSKFSDFVNSPFFNKRKDLIVLTEYLKGLAPEFTETNLEKTAVFKAIYSDQQFDERQLGYVMNYMMGLVEKYLGWKKLADNENFLEIQTLNTLSEFQKEGHFQHVYKRVKKNLSKKAPNSVTHFYNQFLLSDIASEEFSNRKIRKFNDHLQDTVDRLDEYYFLNKLKYTCIMMDWQYLIADQYEINFIEEIKKYLEGKILPPEIKIYLQIVHMLTSDKPESYFNELVHLMKKHFHLFSKNEMKEIYQNAVNFCARKIRAGEEIYLSKTLNLYVDGIEVGVFLENGTLSPWTYTNVSKLALRLQRYEWIKEFIFQNKDLMHPDFRENTFAYNLSELYFYTNQYDKALEQLTQVKFSDLHPFF